MQKRRKRLLALLLAGAMILNLGGFQIGATEVRAEGTQETQEVTDSDENAETDYAVGEQNQEEGNQVLEQSGDTSEVSDMVKFEDKYPTITSIKADRDLSNPIKAGESFSLIFHVVAPEDVRITSFGASYEENNNYQWATISSTQPGAEGIDLKVPVSTNAYASAGKFTLKSIMINSEKSGKSQYVSYNRGTDGNLSPYSYNDETGMFEFGNLVYGGNADYEIAENENADSEVPIINSVRMLTDPVSTAGKVEMEVNYTEEGSGVSYIQAEFANSEGTRQYFSYNAWSNEGIKGNGATLVLENTQARKLNETYSLKSITITDRAGCQSHYQQVSADDTVLSPTVTGLNSIPIISYTVTEEMKAETVSIKGISCTSPKGKEMSDLTAGDTFTVHLQLQNSSKKNKTVKYVALTYAGTGVQKTYDQDVECNVPAGGTADLDIDIQTSEFGTKGIRNLTNIGMTLSDSAYVRYGSDGCGNLQGNVQINGYEIGLDSIVYNGACDYTITEADKEDTEAPYIKSITVLNDNVEAPGWLELVLDVDDGNAKLNSATIAFAEKGDRQYGEIYGNPSIENGQLYYSVKRGCYIAEVQLPEQAYTSDYELKNITVGDEANQTRGYYAPWNSDTADTLKDNDNNVLQNVTVHIKNTVGKEDDGDKQEPILKSISVDKTNVEVPGELTWIIDVEEANGISKINMDYENEDGTNFNVFVDEADIKDLGNGKFSFTKRLFNSMEEGTYKLDGLSLKDGSVRGIWGGYSGNGESSTYSGEADFNVEQKEDAVLINYDIIEEDELADLLENANTNEVVIVGDSVFTLTREAAQVIKKNGLRVIFAIGKYEGYHTEVVIDGKDITDTMIDNIDDDGIAIGKVYAFEMEETLDFGNAYDQAGYEFYTSKNRANIPYTIRMEVGEAFYNAYKEANIRVSKEVNGKNIILKENVQFGENHMLEIRMENTDQDFDTEEYHVSTDTVKRADYNLEVEATPKMSSNILAQGSSFQYEIAITNSNSVAMKNVAVLGMLMNRDGDVIAEDILKQLESEDVKVSYSEESGWVIDEIPAGKTIRLIGTYSIENVDLEKVSFCVGVGSVSEDGGEDDMKSFGMSDEQTLILTDKSATLKGDINLDGQVDMKDLLYMLRIVSGRISEDELSAEAIQNGDVAGNDGTINMSDLKKLLSFISQRITTLE